MPCCCCRFYWWWMIFSRICRPFSSLSYDWRLITIRCNATRLLPTQIASNPTIISSANIGSIRTRTLHQFKDIKEEFISLTSFVFVMYIACWVIRCFFLFRLANDMNSGGWLCANHTIALSMFAECLQNHRFAYGIWCICHWKNVMYTLIYDWYALEYTTWRQQNNSWGNQDFFATLRVFESFCPRIYSILGTKLPERVSFPVLRIICNIRGSFGLA